MSTAEPAQEGRPRRGMTLGQGTIGLGGVLLAISVLLGYDAGLRDFFDPEQIDLVRRNGVLSAFDAEPSTPFELLVPWGAALLASASLMVWLAVRGVAGRAAHVIVVCTVLATLSLLLRQVFLDQASGVPDGSALGSFGALLGLAGLIMLPEAEEARPPRWTALALGVVSVVILTGMVHDAYDTVTYAKGFFGDEDNTSSWPESWLVDGLGARTVVDIGLILVGTLGLAAAALAVHRRLPVAAAQALAAVAALVVVALLIVAIGPNPGISGVDRFPVALLALAALAATAGLAIRLTQPEREPAAVEEPVAPEPAPAPPRPLGPMPPDHVWARPGSPESRGWQPRRGTTADEGFEPRRGSTADDGWAPPRSSGPAPGPDPSTS